MTDIIDAVIPEVVTEVAPSFIDSLPEELRKEAALATFKDHSALAKSYVELQKMVGKKVTDLSPEELALVNKKLNIPTSLEDYAGEDSIPEDLKAKALELKITKESLKGFLDHLNKDEAIRKEMADDAHNLAVTARAKEERDILNKEFGMELDNTMKLTKKALEEFGASDVAEVLTEAGLGSNPAIVRMLAKVGALFEEGKVFHAKNVSEPSSAEASRLLKEKLADKEFKNAYNQATHRNHKATVEEVTRLLRLSRS